MAYKPIPFSTPMVQSILGGSKTMTRRVVKPKHGGNLEVHDDIGGVPCLSERCDTRCRGLKPNYEVGDILWVRETWRAVEHITAYDDEGRNVIAEGDRYAYKADDQLQNGVKWRPSIHMPKAAARIFLRVTDVRAERVQDIAEEDALKEGVPSEFPMDGAYCPVCMGEGLVGAVHPASLGFMEIDCPHCETAKQRFGNLWQRLNAKRGYGWDANPWVWAYTFERIAKPEGWPKCA